ncbi:MAG: prepilin-type N-terminal cleavage/methylation domain-containing protein [Cyanobacteriota bacterium]|nr:prepilin-type N-terminal cleavage/methylation domain-containing protein [Cyanobacteriota bacterium]
MNVAQYLRAKAKIARQIPPLSDKNEGFTLVEVLVVVIIIGVLAAIAAPGWLGFVNQRRVNATKDNILQALEEAKSLAQKEKVDYGVSFRLDPTTEVPQIAVHPASLDPNSSDPKEKVPDAYWSQGDLGSEIGLKSDQILILTNLAEGENTIGTKLEPIEDKDIRTIAFDYTGALKDADDAGLEDKDPLTSSFSIVVAQPKGQGSTDPVPSSMRCVMVKTLLGGLVSGRREYDASNNPDGCPL